MLKMYNKTVIEFGFRMISWIIKTSCLCYLPQPSASADNTDFGFDNSWYHAQPHSIIVYYSFKIFPRFWLVKTTRIIHHNQLLSTKFGKNLRRIESMTSKVEPSENFILNHWRQNGVKSASRCRLLNRWPRKPGDKVVLYLVSGKTKSEMAKLL